MTQTTDIEGLLKPAEAAAYLRVHVVTLAQWRLQKRGPPFVRVGHLVRYRRADVDEWLTKGEK